MNLTPNFTLEELTRSNTAIRLGIDNTPPQQVLGNLRVLAGGLELVRSMTGQPLIIHDGYRCEALERVLCQKDYVAWCARHARQVIDTSWAAYFAQKAHPQGFAADFTCAAFGTPAEIVRAIRASGIKFDEVIMEGTWVHISFASALRNIARVAVFDANGTPSYSDLKAA